MLRGAFSERPFRLLFAGRAVSAVGDRLVPVALAFAVLRIGSVSDLGLVFAAQGVAVVLFVLVGGVWADRLPRQRVMLAADAVRGVAQALSAALLIAGSARIWELMALQAVYGAAQSFFTPASVAIVPEAVAREHLQQANGVLELTDSVCSFVGPALAGVIIAVLDPGWGLAFDAVTFALGAAFLVRLAPRAGLATRGDGEGEASGARAPSALHGLRDAWRAFRSYTWMWAGVLYFTFYIGFVFAPWQVLGPKVALDALGGSGAWAAISAALGAGALGGGLLALRWKPRHPLRAGFLAFAATPFMFALLAAHAPLGVLVLLALLDGAAGSLFNTLWFTAQHTYVPAAELARVSSWDLLGTLAAYPLGLALAGPVAAAIGISTTLYGAGALALALMLLVLAVPAVRNFPDGAGMTVAQSGQ